MMKPFRHLSAAEVAVAMPPLSERLRLAEQTLRALGGDAEMAPKIGLHPRQPSSLAHAMPALLRGEAEDGSTDLLGVKWITGFPANPGRGLATYHALVLLSDSMTGEPRAVMDGGAITAQRTAAISGAAIRHFRPEFGGGAGAAPRVAVLGAGAQAHSHLPVIGHLLPGAQVRITDVDSDRAAALAAEATSVDGIGAAQSVSSVRDAVESADVVISVVSFGPDRQAIDPNWLDADVLFIAVDYDMQAPAALAREAYFVVDEREQFVAARSGPTFAGYPDPDSTMGDLLRGVGARPGCGESNAGSGRPTGRVLVTHLGVGLADIVFASAILARAEQLGLGRLLPR
jgi:ornithine cyclodeaminase/alanine dehydrogenase-like protein (mu-crystallin family)